MVRFLLGCPLRGRVSWCCYRTAVSCAVFLPHSMWRWLVNTAPSRRECHPVCPVASKHYKEICMYTCMLHHFRQALISAVYRSAPCCCTWDIALHCNCLGYRLEMSRLRFVGFDNVVCRCSHRRENEACHRQPRSRVVCVFSMEKLRNCFLW